MLNAAETPIGVEVPFSIKNYPKLECVGQQEQPALFF
jgi:hypothetical protein